MTRRQGRRLSDWQRSAVRDLKAVAAALPEEFKLRGQPDTTRHPYVRIPVRLKTAGLERGTGGLHLLADEDFVLWVGPNRFSPPLVEVEHNRFVGFPHVLHGRQLCIYLDPAREWNPRRGVSSAVDRLYDWLAEAAAGRFDPKTSLFHAVGGAPHGTSGLPTVVVRDARAVLRTRSGYLSHRADHRLDLHFASTSPEQSQVPVIALSHPLPLGIGLDLIEILARLDKPLADRWLHARPAIPPQSPAFLTALAASASRSPEDSLQMFVLTVPHPAGGAPHLLAGRLPAQAANRLRRQVRERRSPLIEINVKSLDPNTSVEWCSVSDERDSVTTRRDIGRPVNAFRGKIVHVWGCGGLGSWIAEFVARAGAKRLVLCDPGTVTGGLLVRQNFAELDVGNGKAEALRDRILVICDDIEVDAHSGTIPAGDVATNFMTADVVIDATVSHAIGQLVDDLARAEGRPLFAQVATDVKTGTLGIVTVSPPDTPMGPNEVDRRIGKIVTADGGLEPFHTFWTEAPTEEELIPTRGCSVPTFHGSAADMAAVAASLTSLLGAHVSAAMPVSGTHLIALPHSPAGPSHTFVELETVDGKPDQ